MDTPLNHSEFEQLAAGWVLGALEPEDENAFQRHLSGCDRCEASIHELEAVVADLAYSAPPVDPPASLWPSIRSELGATARSGRIRVLRPRPQSPWPMRLAAAACVVLLLTLGVWNLSLQDTNSAYRRRIANLEQVAGLLNDPTTRSIPLKGQPVAAGVQVTVLASSSQDRGVLLVDGLPPSAPGKVYELWCVPGGKIAKAQKATVFLAGERLSLVPFAGPLQPTMVYAVTEEPGPQGSEKPTSQPILVGSPPASA